MENTHNKTFTLSFVAAAMASALMFAPSAMATEPTEPAEQTEQTLEKEAAEQQERIEQERNPGAIRATNITLTDLPTSVTGLETGALYNDNGTVKVA